MQCLRAIGQAGGLDLRRRFLLERIVNTYRRIPGVETPGYYPPSLRDETQGTRPLGAQVT